MQLQPVATMDDLWTERKESAGRNTKSFNVKLFKLQWVNIKYTCSDSAVIL